MYVKENCSSGIPILSLEASIIVPVRDEQSSIGPICEAFERLVRTNQSIRELIFIDDGSRDRTLDQIKDYSIRSSSVKYAALEKHMGKGAAIRTGFRSAAGEILVIMDGDQQYSPFEIPGLLEPILSGSADLVVGQGKNIHTSTIRQVFSSVYQALFTRIFKIPISNPNEGLKAVIKTSCDELGLTANGFDFDIELLVKAKKNNLRIVQVPVERHERHTDRSKVHVIPTAIRFCATMAILWFSQEK